MNKKLIDGKEIKVELSRSRGGDRGGFRGGDRGGFRGGRDRDNGFRGGDRGDRGPRRDYGDRPKGCFNCGKEGHMARDCSERNFIFKHQPVNQENSTETDLTEERTETTEEEAEAEATTDTKNTEEEVHPIQAEIDQ